MSATPIQDGIERKIRNHPRVVRVMSESERYLSLEVETYGNCSLFGAISDSNRFAISNVATTDDGNLKVNARKL